MPRTPTIASGVSPAGISPTFWFQLSNRPGFSYGFPARISDFFFSFFAVTGKSMHLSVEPSDKVVWKRPDTKIIGQS